VIITAVMVSHFGPVVDDKFFIVFIMAFSAAVDF